MIRELVLIGAGRIAQILGPALLEADCVISMVYNRNEERAEALAEKLGTKATDDLSSLPTGADLYLILVSDSAIASVASELGKFLPSDANVVHVSGATPATVLKDQFPNSGIFYPFQSFSENQEVNWREVPLCVFAFEAQLEEALWALASKLSSTCLPA